MKDSKKMLELMERQTVALEKIAEALVRAPKLKSKKVIEELHSEPHPLVDRFLNEMYERTGVFSDYAPRGDIWKNFDAWLEMENLPSSEWNKINFGKEVTVILGPSTTVRDEEGTMVRANRGIKLRGSK